MRRTWLIKLPDSIEDHERSKEEPREVPAGSVPLAIQIQSNVDRSNNLAWPIFNLCDPSVSISIICLQIRGPTSFEIVRISHHLVPAPDKAIHP